MVVVFFFFFCLFFGPYLEILGSYFWLAQGFLLVLFKRPYKVPEIEPRSATMPFPLFYCFSPTRLQFLFNG